MILAMQDNLASCKENILRFLIEDVSVRDVLAKQTSSAWSCCICWHCNTFATSADNFDWIFRPDVYMVNAMHAKQSVTIVLVAMFPTTMETKNTEITVFGFCHTKLRTPFKPGSRTHIC